VQGTGIRAGNLEIHPEFSSRIGYDTNVFRGDGGDTKRGGQPEQGAGIFYATPGISISTIGRKRMLEGEGGAAAAAVSAPPKVQLKAGGFLTYFRYIGLSPTVQGINYDGSIDVEVMPKRAVSLDMGASARRSAQPFAPRPTFVKTDTAKEREEWRKSQAYDLIVPRARLNFQSRGEILTGFVGYRPTIMQFEGVQYKYLSSAMHDVDAGVGWKFFPSTSLLYDMTFSLVDYYKTDKAPGTNAIVISDSRRIRARMGVNGAFTKQLSLRVLAGYAAGFFTKKQLDEYETPIGEAVLMYKFGGESQSVAEAGYVRNVAPSAVGGFTQIDRGYAKLKFVLARMFAMTAEAGAGRLHYGKQLRYEGATDNVDGLGTGPIGGPHSTKRVDTRIDALVRAEYRVTSWLGVLAEGIYMASITNFKYQAGTGTPDPAGYKTFQVNGGLRASY